MTNHPDQRPVTERDAEFFRSAWFLSRPPNVQEAYRKFNGVPLNLEGFEQPHYMLGVSENKATGACGIWVSPVKIEHDDQHDLAHSLKFKVCSCCMQRVHIPSP